MNVQNYIDEFLEYREYTKKQSKNTLSSYNSDLTDFNRYLADKEYTNVKDITLRDLNLYITECSKQGLVETTLNRRIASIKSLFKYMQINKIIDSNVALGLENLKIPSRIPVYLNVEESTKLLNKVEKRRIKPCYNKRDIAIMTIFLMCGLRVSELHSINVDDIKEDSMNIIGKGNKERPVYLTDTVKTAIQDYLAVRPQSNTNALFISRKGQRISVSALQRLVKRYSKDAEIDKKISPHKLRHSFCTMMYESGVDLMQLQSMMSHESLETTKRYTHLTEKAVKESMSKHPLNKK